MSWSKTLLKKSWKQFESLFLPLYQQLAIEFSNVVQINLLSFLLIVWCIIKQIKFRFIFFNCRYSARRRIFSFIHRFICARQSRTNVHNAQRHSPIPAIYRSTLASIWASNRIAVKFVSENSRNYHTCSNTFVLIPVTNRTSVVILVAKRRFHSYRICNRIRDAIKLTNHSNAIRATNALAMNRLCSSTFQNIRIQSTWKRTFANTVENHTHRKRI